MRSSRSMGRRLGSDDHCQNSLYVKLLPGRGLGKGLRSRPLSPYSRPDATRNVGQPRALAAVSYLKTVDEILKVGVGWTVEEVDEISRLVCIVKEAGIDVAFVENHDPVGDFAGRAIDDAILSL